MQDSELYSVTLAAWKSQPYSATSLGFGPGPPVARTSVSNSDQIIKVDSGLRL